MPSRGRAGRLGRRPGHGSLPLELTDDGSIRATLACPAPDAVVHLAAIASDREAREDPGRAWEVNAAGTARLAEALARRRASGADPLLLVVSTGEVYGLGGPEPRRESDELRPASPYAASKVAAEVAVLEVWRRTGLRAVIARPVHPYRSGPAADASPCPGSSAGCAPPRRAGQAVVSTGNLEPVRDLLDVRDVVEAYLALLERGTPGEAYNVARGEGRVAGRDVPHAGRPGRRARPSRGPTRPSPARATCPTWWATRLNSGGPPAGRRRISLDQTLRGLVDAEAH